MEYRVGVTLSLSVAVLAALVGLDREQAFYPTVLIVIASYYVLFAVMAASKRTLAIEVAVSSFFLLLAILGFKKNLWVVAIAMVGHGVFDLVHHFLIDNPGVPLWWPAFCLILEAILGGLLALRLTRRSLATH